MNIIIDKLDFSNINDFTDYLINQYEQDKALIDEVHLSISYDAREPENNTKLLNFILMPERSRRYKVDLIPKPYTLEQAAFNRLLEQVYETGELAPVIVRKAKLNWVESKKIAAVGLQTFSKADVKEQDKLPEISTIDSFFDDLIELGEQLGTQVDNDFIQSVMDKTKAIIQDRKKEESSIISFLSLLLKKCSKDDKAGLSLYLNLVSKFETIDAHNLTLLMKIITVFAKNEKHVHLNNLMTVFQGLETHHTLLNSLAELFEYPPYPDFDSFTFELAKDKKDLKLYIESFDKDPKSTRAAVYNQQGILVKSREQILEEQFDTTQIRKTVIGIQSLVDGCDLSSKELYDLTQQIIYINAIGKDHPLLIQSKTYVGLANISRSQLRELSDLLIIQVRDPLLSTPVRLKAQLNLLAVLREQYFRTTGELVQNSELLSILLSLNNQPHSMLMELDNQHEKSSATVLLAAMQWVFADGGSVDICVGNRKQVAQDYRDRGTKNFFTYLGIPSAEIKADAQEGTYQVGGVNYSTIADLALYRLRAQAENEDLIAKKSGQQLCSNLIINGTDFLALDDRVQFSIVSHESKKNPDDWIYPLINEFINQEEFKRVVGAPGEVWSEEHDLTCLKVFLEEHASTATRKQQLKDVSDNKFSAWINSACFAQQLVEGKDFVVSKSGSTSLLAVPLYYKVPQVGFTFNKGVQQFLHARLQKIYPSRHFVINAEIEVVDFSSTKDLIDLYKNKGRVVGVFDRLGTKHDLVAQRATFDIDVAYQLSPHKTNKYQEAYVIADYVEQVSKIKNLIAQAKNNQPIVLLAQNANQVKALFKELSQQFEKEDKAIEIGAFTGQESQDVRQQWANKKAGQPHTITIVNASLAEQTQFSSEHENGFLAIQTDLDMAGNLKTILDCFGGKSKSHQYVALYENNGSLCSSSWVFHSEQNKKDIIDGLNTIQSKKKQEIAIEQYYTQTVITTQQTVLKQFDEWQAFLHLIHPQSEWKKLDNELFMQREELISSLAEQWVKYLDESDPEKKYYNPYVRRDVKHKLQTSDLDALVKDYEGAVDILWKSHRLLLKEKTENKIKEGSLNALRCKYLEDVTLQEQLQLNKVTLGQKKKAAARDKKNTNRYLDSGLDVNGAMLAYSDVPLAQYKLAFAKSQVKLLAKDIAQEINNSSLSANIKALLIERISKAEEFLDLELIFNDYNRWLKPEQFAEKYRMQPIIKELVRVYASLGLQQSEELQLLIGTYVDNVALEIGSHLENSLSWALEENRGLGYWLERSAVKTAAKEILTAVALVKNAIDTSSRQAAIKHLYKVLARHQAQLDGLWIFSFGHENTRDLIDKTLKTIDGLCDLGSEKDQLDAAFIQESKEAAYADLIKEQFNAALQQIEEQNSPWIDNHPHWKDIKEQLNALQDNNKTIYAIDELYYLLCRSSNKLHKPNEPLYKPVIELRGMARSIWNKFYQNHKDLVSLTSHFIYKAECLQKELQEIQGFETTSLKIKPCYNGFRDCFDLIIEGTGTLPLFDDFIAYNSQIIILEKEHTALKSLQEQNRTQINSLQLLQQEQNSVLKSKVVDLELVPKLYRDRVNEIRVLKAILAGKLPDNLSDFPQMQMDLIDRNLIKTFEFAQLKQDQIEQLQNQELKADFIVLYNKMNGLVPKQTKSWFSTIVGILLSPITPYETVEDWRYHFSELQGRPDFTLNVLLEKQINQKSETLVLDLIVFENEIINETKILDEQIEFLEEKINVEKSKTGVRIKRFENLGELYDFEHELKTFRATQPEPFVQPVPVVKEEKESALNESTVVIDEEVNTKRMVIG